MPLVNDSARAFMPYPDAPVPHRDGGPLSGLSFGVKDLFDVAGYPTSGGQPLLLAMSGLKTSTAPAVQRLLDAGARFMGKTITEELAFSMTGRNAHFGTPMNGAAPQRLAGGSSSGSASAVSAGLCDFALGTDTAGSVRGPASHCGLLGLRPTHGRVSLEDALALAPSLDTCGWFARDIETFARVADVLLGADTRPLARPARLLLPTDLWEALAPEVVQALSPARARIETLTGPAQAVRVAPEGLKTAYEHLRHIQGREAWAANGDLIERFSPPLGPGVAERMAWARSVTESQATLSAAYRIGFRERLAEMLGDDGVLLLPTMPDVAPLVSADEASMDRMRHAAMEIQCIASLAGFPQLTLPLASRLGAPLGISLLGPEDCDRSLVQLGERVLAMG